jgi:hypothetical protein
MSAYDPKRTSNRRRSGPPPVVIGDVVVAVPPQAIEGGLPTTFDYGGNTPARRNDNMSDEAAARAPVLRNVLDSYFKAIAARDPSRLALVFAEDGEIEDPVGTPVRKGRLFASGMALASDVEVTPTGPRPFGPKPGRRRRRRALMCWK